MSVFDYSAYKIDATTLRPYTFDMIEGSPKFMVAPAAKENEEWHIGQVQLVMEKNAEAAKRDVTLAAPELTPQDIVKGMDLDFDKDLVLIARHCVKDWPVPPIKADGEPAEFSEQNVLDFLRQIPERWSSPFVNWAKNIYNFEPRAAKKITESDARAMGNASPSD